MQQFDKVLHSQDPLDFVAKGHQSIIFHSNEANVGQAHWNETVELQLQNDRHCELQTDFLPRDMQRRLVLVAEKIDEL